jgi:hypothetical protein
MRKRQVHFRLSEREYDFLLQRAQSGDDTIAAVLRRLIHAEIKGLLTDAQRQSIAAVPPRVREGLSRFQG